MYWANQIIQEKIWNFKTTEFLHKCPTNVWHKWTNFCRILIEFLDHLRPWILTTWARKLLPNGTDTYNRITSQHCSIFIDLRQLIHWGKYLRFFLLEHFICGLYWSWGGLLKPNYPSFFFFFPCLINSLLFAMGNYFEVFCSVLLQMLIYFFAVLKPYLKIIFIKACLSCFKWNYFFFQICKNYFIWWKLLLFCIVL